MILTELEELKKIGLLDSFVDKMIEKYCDEDDYLVYYLNLINEFNMDEKISKVYEGRK